MFSRFYFSTGRKRLVIPAAEATCAVGNELATVTMGGVTDVAAWPVVEEACTARACGLGDAARCPPGSTCDWARVMGIP